MTLPSKNTRKITIGNVRYLWHLNDNWTARNSWIVVAREAHENCQILLIDPYHHDILPKPSTIASAIRFGIAHGWNPLVKGPPVRLAYNGQSFEKLPGDLNSWEHHQDMKYFQ